MTASRTFTDPVDGYVREVLSMIPRPLPERGRIEMELRSHLAEQLEAGVPPVEAVRRMGPADEVARGYLAEIRFTDASVLRRLGAFLIDMALGAVILAPFVASAWWLLTRWAGSDAIPWPVVVVLVIILAVPALSVAYFPVLEALFGQTVGKRAVGIYVVRETGEAIGWGPAILRRLPFFLEIFWIDAVFALFTRRRQRAFDLVARTVVVRS